MCLAFLSRGQAPRLPKARLFDVGNEPSEEVLLGYLEQGRYFLGTVAMEESRCEEAIELFEKVSTPEAAFFQAQVPSAILSSSAMRNCGTDVQVHIAMAYACTSGVGV